MGRRGSASPVHRARGDRDADFRAVPVMAQRGGCVAGRLLSGSACSQSFICYDSLQMGPEEFTYPLYTEPLLEAYGGIFECVLVVLHPFVRVPAELAWSARRQYPSDLEILTQGKKVSWTEVAAATGLKTCARINQALLTSIGSLTDHLADAAGRDALQEYLGTEPVWMPTEGRFEPILHPDILHTFATAGADELIFVPEFLNSDPVAAMPIADLYRGAIPFPARGTLLAPDHSFLFTVDWDSFFTLFYGSRALVTRVASGLKLEGFFATPTTEHGWYNYSFGCATVTLSPEHWQTADGRGVR